MALILCEECEKEISNKAEHCVHCGAPVEGTQLLDDEELRDKMSNLGYERVKNELSWDYESKKLVDFYKKVLN